MPDINSLTIVGRLTKDAEIQTLANNTTVLKISVANNYSKKTGDNWQDEVSYYDAQFFNASEKLANCLTKGKQIAVTGCIRQDRWITPDGQKQSKIKILVSQVQLLSNHSHNDQPVQTQASNSQGQTTLPENNFDYDDDIPF